MNIRGPKPSSTFPDMKRFLSYLIVAALAVGGTWLVLRPAASDALTSERKLLYYQSPMHPWVKSDQPGRCTVCGMALVPVYEGEGGAGQEMTSGVVMLPPGSPNVVGVLTATVQKEPLRRTLRVAGMIDDDESRHRVLSAYTQGRIEKLNVNFLGAEVQAGQPLATFYSADLLSASRDYQLAVRQAGGSSPDSARLRLIQLGLTKEQIEEVPSRAPDDIFFELLAPIDGTVVTRHVYEGQYVEEGDPLFELADFSTMWFQFIAYEQDLPFLQVGQPVSITTPSLPGKTIEAPISFINPNLDDMTRSAKVRVEFENPKSSEGVQRKYEFLHKLYAEATIAPEGPEVLTVPRQAVLWPGKQPRVYVELGDGTYQQRLVSIGRMGDDHYEVIEGLEAGEKVVLNGNMLLDSQAQLDALVTDMESPEAMPSITTESGETPRIDAALWEPFLRSVDDLNLALADDDVSAVNASLKKLPMVPPGLTLTSPPPTENLDLSVIRKAYLPWSEEIVAAAAKHRDAFPDLRIFRCPMTGDLWSGAPAKAAWIQLSPGVRNPYWGREMRDCGAEVKP